MYEKYYTARKPLINSYCKIKEGKINVGYLGGSITSGVAASDSSTTSYRALVTRYLKEAFPFCTVTELEAAIGGTGSDYGAYRIERDLFSKGIPDLCFVEFPVNDHYRHINTHDYIIEHYESIVLKLLAKNPYCDIVVLLTNERGTMNCPDFFAKVAHNDVASHYALATVRIGDALGDVIGDVGSDERFFTYFNDPYHPIDAGYKVYADTLFGFLNENFADGEYKKHELPIRLSKVVHLDTDIINGCELSREGSWKTAGVGIKSGIPGDSFECEFEGSEVALEIRFSEISGVIGYSVDGNDMGEIDLWYGYGYTTKHTLVRNLDNGKHTLKVWVSDTPNKAQQSEVSIEAVLVR